MNLVAIKILTGDRAKYLGMVFHRAIDRVLATLASLGARRANPDCRGTRCVRCVQALAAAPPLQGASDGADLSPEGLTLGQRRATLFLILDLESAQSGPITTSPPNSHGGSHRIPTC